MTTLSQRLGLMAFAVLTAALATNVFVLQPPGRGVTLDARLKDLNGTAMSTAAAPAPAARAISAAQAEVDKSSSELTRAIERELKAKGYETGQVDGTVDLITQAAIMAYEADSGLPLTGAPGQDLLRHIVLGTSAAAEGRAISAEPTPAARDIIRVVQVALRDRGYDVGQAEGRVDKPLAEAIRTFETAQGLRETGRISGELVTRLGISRSVSSLATP